jgi:fused signal recognition particle receptor
MVALIVVLSLLAVVVVASLGYVGVARRRRRELEALAATVQAEAPPAEAEVAPVEAEVAPVEAEVAPVEAEVAPVEAEVAPAVAEAPPSPNYRERLSRARSLLAGPLASLRARRAVDDATWEELEEVLIMADVGVELTAELLEGLRLQVKQGAVRESEQLLEALKAEMVAVLKGDRLLHLDAGCTNVWLFVGVNGVGKTTTIGKVGLRQVAEGNKVVMAAGDTFRAAAADQLEKWADRVGAQLIRGSEGSDPGAVVFDAVQHAAARGADLVLADTAGRLHTKVNHMEELKKVRRVAERPPGKVTEVLLVIDATTGQNGLVQARQFAEAVGVSGVVLTKLDGTAKGGIALAICRQLGIPIKLVGLGEGAGDLVEFDPKAFVDALVAL